MVQIYNTIPNTSAKYVDEDSEIVKKYKSMARISFEKRGKKYDKKIVSIFLGDSSNPYDLIEFSDGTKCYCDETKYDYMVSFNDEASEEW